MKFIKNNVEIDITEDDFKKLRSQFRKKKEIERGTEYYYISWDGSVDEDYWGDDKVDNFLRDSGNFYLIKEEAEKALEKQVALNKINKYIRDNDMEFTPDWKDESQYKYCVYSVRGDLEVDSFWSSRHCLKIPYLASIEHTEQLIKDCKKELLVLFS